MTVEDAPTPDALGAPGQKAREKEILADPTLRYFADGSFYAAVLGFFLPGVAFIWANITETWALAIMSAGLALMGPAAIGLGVTAQSRRGVRWRNGTAWLGIFVGLIDTVLYSWMLLAILTVA